MYQINWTHFTLDERKLIEKIIAQGEHKKITKLIVVASQQQENEITRFIESVAPKGAAGESAVREQIKLLRRKGEEILSPEQEAEWQKKLDEEANPVRTAIAEETAKLKAELTKAGVNFPASASYEQLKAIKAAAGAAASEEKEEEEEEEEEEKTEEKTEEKEEEGTAHVVTAEDLEANPELKDEGVKVGDTIRLPKVDDESGDEEEKDEDESEEDGEEESEETDEKDEKKEGKEKKVGNSKVKKGRPSNKK